MKLQKLCAMLGVGVALFILIPRANAYEGDTHAYLTNEAVALYGKSATSTKIDASLLNYLLDGARHEDTAPRWMNHFYDPVHQVGFHDPTLGTWETSRDWASDSNNQNGLTYKVPSTIASILSAIEKQKISEISSNTDFTWQTAINHYVKGEKETAMYALGHILHLLEDASVPDHTRNDAHPGDSPYENWTAQFTLLHKDPNLTARLGGAGIIGSSGLNTAFDELAKYSNNNFYSKDTIGIQSGFNSPEPDYFAQENGVSFGFRKDENKKDYRLFLNKATNGSFIVSNYSNVSLDDQSIKSDYWSRLSTKAVQYAAGVVDLFFKEAEAAGKNPVPIVQKKSFFGNIGDAIGGFTASVVGAVNGLLGGNGQVSQASQSDSASRSDKSDTTNQPNALNGANQSEATLYTDTQVAHQGETITIRGENFPVSGVFVLRFVRSDGIDGSDWSDRFTKGSRSVTVDATGKFSKSILITDYIEPGNYSIDAIAVDGNRTGNTVIVSVVGATGAELSGLDSAGLAGETDISNEPDTTDYRDVPAQSSATSTPATSTLPHFAMQAINTTHPPQCSFLTSVTPSHTQVILNEIAWMGSEANANAEWIELKNITSASVDISGWQIVDKGEQIKIVIPQNTILPAYGLYLLERTNDDAVPYEQANLIYSGALSNSDEGVRLFNAQCGLVDEALANPNWPAGDNATRRTMERNADLTWHTFGGNITNKISGTPKRENGTAFYVPPASGGGGGGGGGASNPPSEESPAQSSSTEPLPNFRINEIMYNPSGTDVGHEWIEILNEGTSTISLADVKVTESGARHVIVYVRGPESLSPGDYAVIADDTDTFLLDYGNYSGALFKSSFSLSNDGEPLALTKNDITIDSVTYGSSTGAYGDGDSLQYFTNGWKVALPTPGMINIQGVHFLPPSNDTASSTATSTDETATSTATSTPDTATSTATSSIAGHLVMSEILFDAEGTDAGKEFIELYNPGDVPRDLTGWSLTYTRGDATSSTLLASLKDADHGSDNATIQAHGFLLAGLQNYLASSFGITADSVRAPSLPNGGTTFDDSVRLALMNAEGNEIDAVRYNADAIHHAGQSIERRAWHNGGCVSAQDDGEFLGNGCAAGDPNDFEMRDVPNPQNSSSMVEPRSAPAFATSSVAFDFSTMQIRFAWNEASDAEGVTSTVSYELYRAGENVPFATATGTTVFASTTDTVNVDFSFEILARDRDGFASDLLPLPLHIPSFFSVAHFYSDPHATSQTPVFEASYNRYPFVPDVYWNHTNTSWKAMVAYLNTDPGKINELSMDQNFDPGANSGALSLSYNRCAHYTNASRSVIFPDTGNQCSYFGGGLYPIAFSGLEDMHFITPIDGSSIPSGGFSSDDYVTIAFYSFYDSGPGTRFKLVATDSVRHYFEERIPETLPPSPPSYITPQFDVLHMTLPIQIGAATDPDTIDSLLAYEYRYATSSEALASSSWIMASMERKGIVPLVYGSVYMIEARAIDERGNVSERAVREWQFPQNYIPLPMQGDHSISLGGAGAASERIYIPHDVTIDQIAMWFGAEGGPYCCSRSKLGIYADNNGVRSNQTIAVSEPISMDVTGYDNSFNAQWEVLFNFSSAVPLAADTYYWIMPIGDTIPSNSLRIYGSATDMCPNAEWFSNSNQDAYFYLRQVL